MKLYGYEKNSEDMIELNEISIISSIKEMKKLVEFLEHTIECHSSLENSGEACHTHFRDWDSEWQSDQADLVIVTEFDTMTK